VDHVRLQMPQQAMDPPDGARGTHQRTQSHIEHGNASRFDVASERPSAYEIDHGHRLEFTGRLLQQAEQGPLGASDI
jgi:hypothetical protein